MKKKMYSFIDDSKKCRWVVTLYHNSFEFEVMLGKVFNRARADKMKLVDFQDVDVLIPESRYRSKTVGLASRMVFEKEWT